MMIHYLDHRNVFRNGTLVMPLLKGGEQCVLTGTTVYFSPKEDREQEIIRSLAREHGITFFYLGESVEIPFYCVPLVDFFAADANGYFGTLGGFTDVDGNGAIYHVGKNREVHFICETFRVFLAGDFSRKRPAPKHTLQVFDSLEEAKSKLPRFSPRR